MLSVITPVYNNAEYIGDCLRQVACQGLSQGTVEHLLLDGMSEDTTGDILKSLSGSYDHLRIWREADRGQSDAMNKGIRMARGGILGFLNVDDRYEAGTLAYVQDMFGQLPEPSLLVGNCRIEDQNGKLLGINRPAKLRLIDLLSGYPAPYNPCAYFYHRSLHDIIGGYDVNDHYTMDLDFLLRAVQAANVVYVDRVLGTFVWHSGSKTNQIQKSGELENRCEEVRNKYRSALPLNQRILISLRRSLMKQKNRLKRIMK